MRVVPHGPARSMIDHATLTGSGKTREEQENKQTGSQGQGSRVSLKDVNHQGRCERVSDSVRATGAWSSPRFRLQNVVPWVVPKHDDSQVGDRISDG